MTDELVRPILHGYFRSSASYRVRIALNLKGLAFEQRPYHLGRGDQNGPELEGLNPQRLVPVLQLGDETLTQSLAICEYLDEIYPEPPLLPADTARRAHIRAFAEVIACDVHPIQNLKILKRLRALGLDQAQVTKWAAQVIEDGLSACERLVEGEAGPFCFGATPSLADVVLVPQLANGRRFGVEPRWARLSEAEAACVALPAFADAAPDRQPDAE